MPITLNGSGTVTGISAGGLPDGIIQSADLATGVGGKILQVQQTFLNTAVSINGVQSYQDISGFSASITPASSSSKILVRVSMQASTGGESYFQLLRGSTAIGNGSAGNYDSFHGMFGNSARSHHYDLKTISCEFLDTPNTTSATTYKVQWGNVTNITTYLNRTAYSTSGLYYSYSGSSTITLMEVAT